MPGLAANQVTLEEVLEVKGGPLEESELWAILLESCVAARDVFAKGQVEFLRNSLGSLSLETLILSGNGRIKFGLADRDAEHIIDHRFVAPECFAFDAGPITNTSLEKMCVYSLGMIVYAAADYGGPSRALMYLTSYNILEIPKVSQGNDEWFITKVLCLSADLEGLLFIMCEDDPRSRCSIGRVAQACQRQKSVGLSVERIRCMVKSILGNEVPQEIPNYQTSYVPSLSTEDIPRDIVDDDIIPYPLEQLEALAALEGPLFSYTNTSQDQEDYHPATNGHKKHNSGVPRSVLKRGPAVDKKDPSTESAVAPELDYGDMIAALGRTPDEKSLQKLLSEPLFAKPDPQDPVFKKPSPPKIKSEKSADNGLQQVKSLSKLTSVDGDKIQRSSSKYATSDFKRLLTVEEKKLSRDGFLDEERSKIKMADVRYNSMPTLDRAETNVDNYTELNQFRSSVRSADGGSKNPFGVEIRGIRRYYNTNNWNLPVVN